MMQPSLFDHTPSREAYDKVKPDIKALQVEILEALSKRSLTGSELAFMLRKPLLTIRPRLTELGKDMGLIEKAGRRKNDNGNNEYIWRKK